LSLATAEKLFKHIAAVVVDEWHELLGNKRGVQLQLCLARLRCWQPELMVWGLSATLGNLQQARDQLCPGGKLVAGLQRDKPRCEVILPQTIDAFPWAGHMGLRHAALLLPYLEAKQTTLIFLNTRGQAERWYQALLQAKPEWAGQMAIHHSALAKPVRQWVEQQLREGMIKVVVCTSSLDLGVDFSPVEQVVQVGSPKGIARLLQRAGRSHHQPGKVSEILLFPTHAFEIIEYEAAKLAVQRDLIEPRPPLHKPYDVLIQHCVTLALGGGFTSELLYNEITQCPPYAELTRAEFESILQFIVSGGSALQAYPEYHKVEVIDGVYQVINKRIAQRHRMNIGTINADAMVNVKFQRGKTIAAVEENFISKLKPGDTFYLNGRSLEFLRMKDLTAIVKAAKKKSTVIPRWVGGRLPLSAALSELVQEVIATPASLPCLNDLFIKQRTLSHIPQQQELLIEQVKTRDGYHTFVFPFAGRLCHEMLASLWSYRLLHEQKNTLSVAVNEYGFEICSAKPLDLSAQRITSLLSIENLTEDLLQGTNQAQLGQQRFRDIARIAGLVFAGYPGSGKSTRQIQASTSLLYNVLQQYDADNLLLQQAMREVYTQAFELQRLEDVMQQCVRKTVVLKSPDRLTPFAFPLWVELQRMQLSSEDLATRIERMLLRVAHDN